MTNENMGHKVHLRFENKWRNFKWVPRCDLFDFGFWVDAEFAVYVSILNLEIRLVIERRQHD